MPRKPCYWTRKLELELVEFVREKEFIWKPIGNTNHHIQQKYKAYAEFAAKLGRGFTARSVRDRWVNIRSTFNHNLRRVDRSRQKATSPSDLYVPCWPLWKPLQFLRVVARKEYEYDHYPVLPSDLKELSSLQVKEEDPTDFEDKLTIRQRGQRTDRPRRRTKPASKAKNSKCKKVINDLVNAMKPLVDMKSSEHEANQTQSYLFFGKYVTERLNAMRECDAALARQDIMRLLREIDDQVQMSVDDGDYVKNELDLSNL